MIAMFAHTYPGLDYKVMTYTTFIQYMARISIIISGEKNINLDSLDRQEADYSLERLAK